MTEGAAGIAVQVVRAFPNHYDVLELQLGAAACVADALDAARRAGWDVEAAGIAIYGRLVGASAPLHDGDRVELLRALIADPMQRRRARALPRGR